MGGGGKGGGSSKMTIAQYRMSIHIGVCKEVDAFRKVYINEKLAWEGSRSNSAESVNKPNLFGGEKKEGGIYGRMHFLSGVATQVLPTWLRSKLTGTIGVPSFRGIASIFFTGNESIGSQLGFLWSSNVPYIRPIWVTAERRPRGLSQARAWVDFDAGTVNPAHIIYECMTNTVWGMGAAASQFDVPYWENTAQRLLDENMGLAFKWDRQSSIEEFVNEVLAHIDADIVQDPQTMRYQLRLVRDDYDLSATKILDESNTQVQQFKRPVWGETINEIVVTWTNPETEQEETVAVQDLGNIAAQGSVVSDSRNYEGVRTGELADRLARRDLRVAASPLASAEVTVDRSFWDSVEGDVVRFNFPRLDSYMLPMRITKINIGSPGSSRIRLSLVEDVFALPLGGSYTPPDNAWQNPSEVPRAVPLNMFHIFSLPFALAAAAEINVTEGQEPLEYPQERAGVLMTQSGTDTYAIDLQYFGSDAAGNPGWYQGNRFTPLGYATVPERLLPEIRSVMPIINVPYGKTRFAVGQYIIVGATSNFNEINPFNNAELMLVEWIDETAETITLRRGCLDTVPLEWEAGTPLWILNDDVSTVEMTRIYSDAAEVSFRLLPITSQGSLDAELANVKIKTLKPRPFQPLRPTNIKINGQDTLGVTSPITASELTFTWSNRNRFAETSQPLVWNDPAVTPEPGQVTVVELWNGDPAGVGVMLSRVSTATSTATLTGAQGVGTATHWCVYSELEHTDAGLLTSFSKQTGALTVMVGGFGYDFGNNFGNAL